MRPLAVFLDRDGVLNVDRPGGVVRPEDFELLPGALEALAILARERVPVHVVTNQANVGREVVDEIHRAMLADVRRAGGEIASVHVCYHAPEDGCDCRKPAPGLLLRAAREHSLDLARVVLVGDDRRDLEAARAAGAVPVLVRTGKGAGVEKALAVSPLPPRSG